MEQIIKQIREETGAEVLEAYLHGAYNNVEQKRLSVKKNDDHTRMTITLQYTMDVPEHMRGSMHR